MQPTQSEHALTNFRQDLAARDDVGDSEAAAGLQNAEGFAQNSVLVGGKIDDAVGDDDVDGIVGQRNAFDFAFQEFDIVDARLPLVLVRKREHLVGHVEAIGFAGGADTSGGEQDIDTATGTKIEHSFSRLQLSQSGWIAAAERGQHGFFGNLTDLGGVVKVAGDGIAAAGCRRVAPQQELPPAVTRSAASSVFLL